MGAQNKIVACIDPGVNPGLAIYLNGLLIDAYYVTDVEAFTVPIKADVVVLEHLYIDRHSRQPPNDIVKAQLWGAFLAGKFQPKILETVLPSEWKGQVPKDVHNKWIISKLSADEVDVIKTCTTKKSKLHNVIDAAGIGLWYLKRR